ncbi:hypothetical protein ACEOHC_003925 [Salmonella enterica]
MATFADLTDQQKADLKRLLNNLNLGLAKAHFGDLYLELLAGNKPQVTEIQLYTIRTLLNKLNLGTYHFGFGDYVAELLDPPATATVWADGDIATVEKALNKLNIPLARLGFGSIATGPQGTGSTGTGTTTPAVTNPAITTQPTGKTVTAPAKVTLEVKADDATDYQWQKKNGSKWDDISGATAAKFEIATSATTDSGTYRVVVSGATGSTPVTSDEVTVTVNAAAVTKKTFKVVDGTATGYTAKKVSLTAADGMKTLTVTDDKDAKITGVAVALTTAGDSSKLDVALNSDGKTIELTPVAGETGDVKFKITHADYTTLEITATLA